MWIKKEEEVVVVEELSSGSDRIQESNAYEVTITGARLAESQQKDSKSLSLVIDVSTENGETAREFFTILGKDGKSYFVDKRSNVKKQHIGLTIANSLFQLVLDKEIFDVVIVLDFISFISIDELLFPIFIIELFAKAKLERMAPINNTFFILKPPIF